MVIMGAEQLVFHIVPTRYRGSSDSSESYKRVVGISTADKELWIPPDRFSDDSLRFDSKDTEAIALDIPNWFGARAARYFKHFYVDEPIRSGIYCHGFGLWMEGAIEIDDNVTLQDGLDDILDAQHKIRYPLEVGQHGVLARAMPGWSQAKPLFGVHSIIGLGTDRSDCLQVVGPTDFMGINTYEAVINNSNTTSFNTPRTPVELYGRP
jgi:hypothetical protein